MVSCRRSQGQSLAAPAKGFEVKGDVTDPQSAAASLSKYNTGLSLIHCKAMDLSYNSAGVCLVQSKPHGIQWNSVSGQCALELHS